MITPKVYIDWNDDGDFSDANEDVTDDLLGNITIDRGRSDLRGSLSPGTCEFTLRNNHQKYSPEYALSPIYGDVLPHRSIKVEIELRPLEQLTQVDDLTYGYSARTAVAQSFRIGDVPRKMNGFKAQFDKVGNPVDTVEAKLYDEDWNVLATSTNAAGIGDIGTFFTWNFASYTLNASQWYAIGLVRTGAISPNSWKTRRCPITNPFEFGIVWGRDNVLSWTLSYPNDDMYFQVLLTDEPNLKRFYGRIKSYKYSLGDVQSSVDILAYDRLDFLSEQYISKTVSAGDTLKDVTEAILTEAGLAAPEYIVGALLDTDVLEDDFTWTDVGVVDILNEITQTGHHLFYIDGSGVLQVRHRYWRMTTAAYATYYTDATHTKALQKVSDLDWAVDPVMNDMIVGFDAGDKTSKDTASQALYGIRTRELNLDLMDSMWYAHAQCLAWYHIFLYKNVIWYGTLSLKNTYPDCLDIMPGTVVRIIDAIQSLDTNFIVMGMHESINRSGEHILSLRVQERIAYTNFSNITATSAASNWTCTGKYNDVWVSQLTESGASFRFFGTTNTVLPGEDKIEVAQSFQEAPSKILTGIKVWLTGFNNPSDKVAMALCDSSWNVLAVSTDEHTPAKSPYGGGAWNWSAHIFHFNYTLAAATEYRFRVYRTGGLSNSNYYRIKFKLDGIVNPYANGKFYYLGTGGWVASSDPLYADLTFRLYIKNEVYGNLQGQRFTGAPGFIDAIQFYLEALAGAKFHKHVVHVWECDGAGVPILKIGESQLEVPAFPAKTEFSIPLKNLSAIKTYLAFIHWTGLEDYYDNITYQTKVYGGPSTYPNGNRMYTNGGWN